MPSRVTICSPMGRPDTGCECLACHCARARRQAEEALGHLQTLRRAAAEYRECQGQTSYERPRYLHLARALDDLVALYARAEYQPETSHGREVSP